MTKEFLLQKREEIRAFSFKNQFSIFTVLLSLLPVQLYPSPLKPERQVYTGSPSWYLQNQFGPQDREQPVRAADDTNVT